MKKTKERRCLNIDKENYDAIKTYCDTNALNMTKWVVAVAKEQMSFHPDPFVEMLRMRKDKK